MAPSFTSKSPFSFVMTASSGKLRRAGPLVTLPSGSNVEPWQGQWKVSSGPASSLHFRCVQTAESANRFAPRRTMKNPGSRKRV